jgi:hypothetical protein
MTNNYRSQVNSRFYIECHPSIAFKMLWNYECNKLCVLTPTSYSFRVHRRHCNGIKVDVKIESSISKWKLWILPRWKRETTKKEIGPHFFNHQLSSYSFTYSSPWIKHFTTPNTPNIVGQCNYERPQKYWISHKYYGKKQPNGW